MYGIHRQEQAIWFARKWNESIMSIKLHGFLVFRVNDDRPGSNMRAALEGFLECIDEKNFTDSLSSKLDTSRQSSEQNRRDLLHPCQFLCNSFGDLVKFDRVGR